MARSLSIGFVAVSGSPGRAVAVAVVAPPSANAGTTLVDWQERARQRRQLLALDDRALQDFEEPSRCRREGYKTVLAP